MITTGNTTIDFGSAPVINVVATVIAINGYWE